MLPDVAVYVTLSLFVGSFNCCLFLGRYCVLLLTCFLSPSACCVVLANMPDAKVGESEVEGGRATYLAMSEH